MATIISVATLTIFLVFVMPYLTKHLTNYRANLKTAMDCMDASYVQAQSLLKDETVPQSVKSFTLWFQLHTGNSRLARRFSRDLLRGEVSRAAANGALRNKEFSVDLEKLTAAQMATFSEMMAHGMTSSAFSDALLANYHMNIWRALMSESLLRDEQTVPSPAKIRTVAYELNERYAKPVEVCAA